MAKEEKYFILYNNGRFETTDKINMAILHMVEMGVIKVLFDCIENKIWVRTEDGLTKKTDVTHVTGLT